MCWFAVGGKVATLKTNHNPGFGVDASALRYTCPPKQGQITKETEAAGAGQVKVWQPAVAYREMHPPGMSHISEGLILCDLQAKLAPLEIWRVAQPVQ